MNATRGRGRWVLFGEPDAPDAERTVREVRVVAGSRLTTLARDLGHALHGDAAAAREYVVGYRLMGEVLLRLAADTRPDLIERRAGPRGERGASTEVIADLFESSSLDAGFSGWRTLFPPEDALALHLTSRLRCLLGLVSLPEPPGVADIDDGLTAQRFLRRVRHHLNHPADEQPLQRIMNGLELSKTDLGRLFGVSRQAIDGWLAHGVPAERQEKLTAMLALIDLLERKLKGGRLAGIARRPAEAYGGRSMLELIATDRHDELLQKVRASFDWSQAA